MKLYILLAIVCFCCASYKAYPLENIPLAALSEIEENVEDIFEAIEMPLIQFPKVIIIEIIGKLFGKYLLSK